MKLCTNQSGYRQHKINVDEIDGDDMLMAIMAVVMITTIVIMMIWIFSTWLSYIYIAESDGDDDNYDDDMMVTTMMVTGTCIYMSVYVDCVEVHREENRYLAR